MSDTVTSPAAGDAFPVLTAAVGEVETTQLLRNPELAIGWALEHLQPFELHEFLTDWKAAADLTSWVRAALENERMVCDNFPAA